MVRGDASISAAISCAVTGRRLRRKTWMMRNNLSARLMTRPCRHAADTMLSAAWQYEKSLLTREIFNVDVLRFRPRFRPSRSQPVRDEKRSPSEDGGRGLQFSTRRPDDGAQGQVSLYPGRRAPCGRFHLHPRAY